MSGDMLWLISSGWAMFLLSMPSPANSLLSRVDSCSSEVFLAISSSLSGEGNIEMSENFFLCVISFFYLSKTTYSRSLTKFSDHSGVWPKVSLVFEDFKYKG